MKTLKTISGFILLLLLAFTTVKAQTTVWSENFNTIPLGHIPSGWTLGDGGSLTHNGFPTGPDTTWCVTDNNWNGLDLGDGKFLFIDSDAAGISATQQDTITSPAINLTGTTIAFLKFDIYYYHASSSYLKIEAYNANTSTWVVLDSLSATTGGWTIPTLKSYDISTLISSQFKFRFIYSGNYSWYCAIDQIRIVSPANDVGVTSVTFPNLNPCSLSANQQVQVTIKNFGANPQTNVPVTFQLITNGTPGAPMNEAYTGTIAPGATVTYTFVNTIDLSGIGTYQVVAYTEFIGGDENPSNDTSYSQIIENEASTTLPIQVNFTGYIGTNLSTVFPGWKEANGTWGTIPVTGNSSWYSDNWLNNSSSTNGKAATVNLYTNSKEGEWIISPKFTVPAGTTHLTYDIGTTDYNSTSLTDSLGSDDTVIVAISTDCGITWSPLKTYTRTNTPPSTGIQETIDLSSYANQTVRIAFYATEGTIDDPEDVEIFLDNINIKQIPPKDLGVTNVVLKDALLNCSGKDSVIITIKNFGSAPQSNFNVYYVLYAGGNPGTPVSATISSTIAPGASMTYTFPTPISVSITGNYYVKAYTSLAGDADATNDTSNSITYKYISTVYTLTPSVSTWIEGFEATNPFQNGWIRIPESNTEYAWQAVSGPTPTTLTGPASALEGSNYAYTEASKGDPGSEAMLITPCFALNIPNPHLSFAYHFYGTHIDKMFIEASTGNGWIKLDSIVGQQQTSSTAPWKIDTISLTAYAGQTIKIRFRAIKGQGVAGDLAIDSVSLWNLYIPTPDLKGLQLSAPDTVCQNQTFDVTAIYQNIGNAVATNITYTLIPNNATQTTSNLPSSFRDTITFSGVSFNAPGQYTIKVYSSTSGDNNSANDTLSKTITVIAPLTFTLTGPTSGVVDSVYCFNTGNINADSIIWTIPTNATVVNMSGDTLRCIKFSQQGNFNVIATAYNKGCISKDTVTIQIIPVQIILGANKQIKIFPNPVSNMLNIYIQGNANAIIYDLRGNKLLEKTISNHTTIDMSNFNKGVYLLHINSNEHSIITKLVKY